MSKFIHTPCSPRVAFGDLFNPRKAVPQAGRPAVRSSVSEKNSEAYRRKVEEKGRAELATQIATRLGFLPRKMRQEILEVLQARPVKDALLELGRIVRAYREHGEDRAAYGATGAIATTGGIDSKKIEQIDMMTTANTIDDGLYEGDRKIVSGAGGGRKFRAEGRDPLQDLQDGGVDDGVDDRRSGTPSGSRRWRGAREGESPDEANRKLARERKMERLDRLARSLIKDDVCLICGTKLDFPEPVVFDKGRNLVERKKLDHVRKHRIQLTDKVVAHLIKMWAPIRDEALARFIKEGTPAQCGFCGDLFLSRALAVGHFIQSHLCDGRVKEHFGTRTVNAETRHRQLARATKLLSEEAEGLDPINPFTCRWLCCKAPSLGEAVELIGTRHATQLSDSMWLNFPRG